MAGRLKRAARGESVTPLWLCSITPWATLHEGLEDTVQTFAWGHTLRTRSLD